MAIKNALVSSPLPETLDKKILRSDLGVPVHFAGVHAEVKVTRVANFIAAVTAT